jgi:membrane-bound metal-dependent hydrolase YbcI (DUF457 family)
MNIKAHFMFGLFTALGVYYVTGEALPALVVFFIQVGLVLDFLFKKAINFEPLHSLIAMVTVWMATFFLWPLYHWYVLAAYFSHLFLDIFVFEEIPLLYPFKKQLMYPIKHSEKFVITVSLAGSLVFLFLLFA